MSVYNGFSTRKQEQDYSILLEQTFFLLQTYILKVIKQEKIDDNKFTSFFEKLFNTLEQFEAHKYLDPKYSLVLRPLAKLLNVKRYQFIDGDTNYSHSIHPNQSSPSHKNHNNAHSSRNLSSSKKINQNTNTIADTKITNPTQTGKYLYQTISEIANQQSQIFTSPTKPFHIDTTFNHQISSHKSNQNNNNNQDNNNNNMKQQVVELKTLQNGIKIQTPQSYKSFCVMSISPTLQNSSTIWINENSSIQLQPHKNNGEQPQSYNTIDVVQNIKKTKKQQQQQQQQQNEVKKQMDQNRKDEELEIQEEEYNIRLDNVVLKKYGEGIQEDSLYDDQAVGDIIQSSSNNNRNNRIYKETTSFSMGRNNKTDSQNNQHSLPLQNLIQTRKERKHRLQPFQQRRQLLDQELQASKKDLNSYIDNQYSTYNEESFFSQGPIKSIDHTNNPQLQKIDTTQQEYQIANQRHHNYQNGLLQGRVGIRKALSKNVSPVNINHSINYEDTNYYPIQHFSKAIPILKPLYQGKKETKDSYYQRIQDQLSQKEKYLQLNLNRPLSKLNSSQSPQLFQQTYLEGSQTSRRQH